MSDDSTTVLQGQLERALTGDAQARQRLLERTRGRLMRTGFYEWLATAGGKQPFHFRLLDGRPFTFAGLWEHWQGRDGAVESCAILTTEANAVVRPVHERMPVILPPEDFAARLDTSRPPEELHVLLRPFPAKEMEARAVSRRVNSPRYEGPDCLAPAG